jgi:hypothetical protein
MIVQIKNENYGYTVATYGDYVVVANPPSLRWNSATASAFHTGSVDYFRYNKNTDQHDYIATFYNPFEPMDILLDTEQNFPTAIETEDSGSFPDYDLLIDENSYTGSLENGYGISLDMYLKLLVVGSPYFTQFIATSASLFAASGSSVSIYDLSQTEYPSTGSEFVLYIDNPDANVSESFGQGVSINNSWIAVGSPLISGSNGMVYMYQNISTGSNYNWSLFQKIDSPDTGAMFGWSLKLNKQNGPISQSIVIGCGNQANGKAYYYEFIDGSWVKTFTFYPTTDIMPMTFANYLPYDPVMNITNGFGYAVSTFDTAVIIGAPFDRTFYEYSGSSLLYQQGSVYIFEKCPSQPFTYYPLTSVPNNLIVWTVGDSSHLGILSGSTTTNESHAHAAIKVNNKLYCGGWDGQLYVLTNPDTDITQKLTASYIAGSGSAVCYSDVTKYLYFISGTPISGSIVKVNPNNLQDQTILVQGLDASPSLLPICTYGNYLYTSIGGYGPNYFTKIDIYTGNIVATMPWVSASNPIHGAHASVMAPDGQYFYITTTNGQIAKVSTSNLSYITNQIYSDFPAGPVIASICDDIAYLNGYVYASVESNGNIFKINASDLSYKAYPAAFNSYGVYADDKNVYLLQYQEIWVYLDGDLESGPIRFKVATGTIPNELWITDGGSFVYTNWTTTGVYSYLLPLFQEIRPPILFQQVLKTYGTPLTLKNNRLGYSVNMFQSNAVAGIPKINNIIVTDGTPQINNTTMTSCYVEGTLDQLHYCEGDLEDILDGQVMLLQKSTSSLNWGITNVYQKKKRYLSPHRVFGDDVSIADKSMVVGAPMTLADSNRQINLNITQSNNISLDNIAGKAYIYNLKNLRESFHVGNVFYRNGKIILMTSGSVFDGLFFNPVNTYTYEYDLKFKGEHTIFEKQIICSVDPGEFNVSMNPTAVYKPTSSLDINQNLMFDFQDMDVLLRYMQYKNTSYLGIPTSTDWSSSLVTSTDEISLLKYYQSRESGCAVARTSTLTSESIIRWEQTDTWMQSVLDFNQDNRIDIRDMYILWKYFTNRLTQKNYASFITPACRRKLFSDVIDYMNFVTQKHTTPQIKSDFLTYENSVAMDKTGSFLAPMATTIGLYSGLDLVAVAKLGSPIKIIPELPFNFAIKMDF